MKFRFLIKFMGVMLLIFAFISIPISTPTVIAEVIVDWDLDLDKQISTDEEIWYDNLGDVLVGTEIFYRVVLTNYTFDPLNILLDDSMYGNFTTTVGPAQLIVSGSNGEVITSTVPTISYFEYGPYLALLGFQSNVISGTVSYTGFTSTIPISPTIIDVASYTGISSAVPEPATLLLIGVGLLGLAGLRRKLKK